ncbi:MAG: TolC family protein [Elusimicrobia bacterium]|jgi:outer membrane protein TolC|nr:TolC family protein [Elusimicrobiota bacterium]
MNRTIRFVPLLIAFSISARAGDLPSPRTGQAFDLKYCYQLAAEKSEPLKRQKESIRQSALQAQAALGGIFPRFSWDWRDIRQESSGMNSGLLGEGQEKNQVESKFMLEQPLFTGLREFSAYSGFKKQQARDQWRLRQSELQLYNEVAQAYFDILSLETAQANGTTSVKLAQERVDELKSFFRLGKSREGEVLSAESQLAALKAVQVHLKGQILVARETLTFLLGQNLGPLPISPPERGDPPSPLNTYLNLAAQRPDLEAQREEILGQALRVRYEKGSYWPSAKVAGNYYTQRPSVYDSIHWDVMLNLNVPLFQGGTVKARVNEARSILTQAQLTLEQAERSVQSDVKKAYAAWTSSLDEAPPLAEAYRTAQKSYEAQRREYRLGLVTNLDVLNAMNLMQAAKRALDDASVESQRRQVALGVATGTLP